MKATDSFGLNNPPFFVPSQPSNNHAPPSQKQYYMKQSEQIMRRLDEIKQSMTDNISNSKMLSANLEKLNKYLPPVDSGMNSHQQSQYQQNETENYRQSLEQRLERLFKDEKELLRERHYQLSKSKQEVDQHQIELKQPTNLDEYQRMENKIKMLVQYVLTQEHKYLKQNNENQTTKQPLAAIIGQPVQKGRKTVSVAKGRQKANSMISSVDIKHNLKKEISNQLLRRQLQSEKVLLNQIQSMKLTIDEIKEVNNMLIRKIESKQQKRKYKSRSRHLLTQILFRLQEINSNMHNTQPRSMSGIKGSAIANQEILERLGCLKEHRMGQKQSIELEKRRAKLEKRLKEIVA